jgi:hypothetical protein
VDGRAVRRVGPAEHAGGTREPLGLVLGEQLEQLHAAGQAPLLLHLLARPLELRLVAGELDGAAVGVVDVESLRLGHAADLEQRVVHRQAHRHGRVPTVPARDASRRRREQR